MAWHVQCSYGPVGFPCPRAKRSPEKATGRCAVRALEPSGSGSVRTPCDGPSAPLLAMPLLAMPLLAMPLLAVPLLAVPLLAVPLLAVPLLAVPLLAVPLLAVPLLAVPLLAVPLLAVPLLAVPLLAVPLLAMPLLAMPLLAMPLLAMPLRRLPCAGERDGGRIELRGRQVERGRRRRRERGADLVGVHPWMGLDYECGRPRDDRGRLRSAGGLDEHTLEHRLWVLAQWGRSPRHHADDRPTGCHNVDAACRVPTAGERGNRAIGLDRSDHERGGRRRRAPQGALAPVVSGGDDNDDASISRPRRGLLERINAPARELIGRVSEVEHTDVQLHAMSDGPVNGLHDIPRVRGPVRGDNLQTHDVRGGSETGEIADRTRSPQCPARDDSGKMCPMAGRIEMRPSRTRVVREVRADDHSIGVEPCRGANARVH